MFKLLGKICVILLVSLFCCGTLVWAGGQTEELPVNSIPPDATESFKPVTFTDSSGREVTITKPVETIAYTHSFSDQLNILGVWDRVIAVDGSHQGGAVQYPGILELPVISAPGNSMGINYEKVLDLDPDIFLTVYIPSIPGFDELVATLEPIIPVVAFNFSDPATMVENFEKLGRLLGRDQAAAEFISFYQSIINDIESRTACLSDSQKPRIFYKMGWGNVDEFVTFTDDFEISPHRSRVTGSVNMAADLPSQAGWVMGVDPEWLINENPDVIIDGGMYHGIIGPQATDKSAAEALYRQIMNLDVLSETFAVKNKNLFILWTDSFMSTSYIINYAYIAKRIHPELFQDFDPVALHQEYFTKYLKVDFDMSKQGIFIYP